MKRTILFVLALLLLFASAASAGSITSGFRFRTIETQHFSIHYHDGLDNVAALAAGYAERAHATMTDKLGWEPREKTQLVLVDAFDFTNGFSTSIPYNAIYVFPVPPELDATLGEYESWLEGVIVHEYAHVLTSDPARGYSELTRKIFGKPVPGADPLSLLGFLATAPPNTFLPRWWHEGMATWAESTWTSRGRDNSVFFDMVFRMDVLEGKVPSIDKINEALPDWPDGHMPYLYGSKLVSHIAASRGADAPGRLNLKHAGRVPYLLNGAPEQLFADNGYKALYQEMVAELEARQRRNIAALTKAPPTVETVLGADGESLTRPRFSPDGKKVAWTRRDPHSHETIVVADADGGRPREAGRRVISDAALSWSPDGTGLYFCQAEIWNGSNLYQDLYRLDVASGKVERLTRGLRLSEADAAPSGHLFAAVVTGRGDRNLAILTPEKGAFRVDNVTRLSRSRVSGPRWSPDGGRVAYVATGENGVAGLYVYDLAGKRNRKLFETAAPLATPAWSPDGKTIVYMSGQTGVFNLFACNASDGGERRQLTHLVGGAFHPDVSPDGKTLAWSSYRAAGFRIASMPWNASGALAGTLPSLAKAAEAADWGELGVKEDAISPMESSSYSALPTVGPRFWLPALFADHEGAVLGALTAGQDVLMRHGWVAEGGVGLGSGEGYFAAKYANDSFPPTLVVEAYSLPTLYSDLFRRGDYWERASGLVVEAVAPILRVESGLTLSLGYQLRKQEALSPLTGGAFAGMPVFEGRRDSLFAKLAYTNALRYPHSISEEEGRKIAFTVRDYSRRWGSDLVGREYAGSWDEFVAMPWGLTRHHALALNLRGGLFDGDRPLQGAFQMGGPPSDLADYPLRGFPSRFRAGEKIATGSLEYRAPIRDIYRGPGTTPFFFDRVHAALFVDGGRTWGDGSDGKTRVGAGIEGRLDMTLGYWLKIEPAIGFAHGFDRDGESTVYFSLRALSL
jgi:Tol biopolymer transport system component